MEYDVGYIVTQHALGTATGIRFELKDKLEKNPILVSYLSLNKKHSVLIHSSYR